MKLVAWAGCGLFLTVDAPCEPLEGRSLQFDPDSLSLIDWATVRAIEAEPVGPHRQTWPATATTLERLVAWAAAGRRAAEHDERE